MEDCSTDERLRQETLCRPKWTDQYVERPETLIRQKYIVVVWFQWLLVEVVRHIACMYVGARHAARKSHFKLNRAFKVIQGQGHTYWCRQKSRTVCRRNVQ